MSALADMAMLTTATAREKPCEAMHTAVANVLERTNKARQSERWKGTLIEWVRPPIAPCVALARQTLGGTKSTGDAGRPIARLPRTWPPFPVMGAGSGDYCHAPEN